MHQERVSLTLEKHGGRAVLTRRDPQYEAVIKGLDLDRDNVDLARRACKNLWAWRNDFDVRRRRSGNFIPAGRITREQADKLLAVGLALISEGGGT